MNFLKSEIKNEKVAELSDKLLQIQQKYGPLQKPKKRDNLTDMASQLGCISEKFSRILNECNGKQTVEKIGIKLEYHSNDIEQLIRKMISMGLIDF